MGANVMPYSDLPEGFQVQGGNFSDVPEGFSVQAPSWGETLQKAKGNLTLDRLAQTAFTNPIEDVKNVGKVILGTAENLIGPEKFNQYSNEQQVARDFAQHYKNYFSEAGIKKNIAENPQAVIGDVVGLLTPGVKVAPRAIAKLEPGFPALPAPAKVPVSTAMKKVQSRLNYMTAKDAGVMVSPGSYGDLVKGMVYKATKEGIDPGLHPKSVAALNRFVQAVDKGGKPDEMAALTGTTPRAPSKQMSLEELDTLRQIAGDAKMAPDAADRRIGAILTDRLDDYLDTLTPKDFGVSAGPRAREGIEAIKKAREQWAQMRRSETIDQILERSGIKEGGANPQGMDALRNEFKQLAIKMTKDARERNRWTPRQRDLIKQLGSISSGVNMLRAIGRLSPRHYFSMTSGGAAAFLGAPYLTGAMWGLGEGAFQGAKAITKNKVNELRGEITGY